MLSVLATLLLLGACDTQIEDPGEVEYAPVLLPADDWPVSTPSAQGLDPVLIAKLYRDAAELTTLYGLLVVRNGHLIAERYFTKDRWPRCLVGNRQRRATLRH